ncbi:hypothetical protein Lfu02_43350 [Longispora fulva]|uniref:Uncharacterized protein n=1 Tax=Longispora fulva TaxID=619741 RepID=A0A8J7GHN5_9ACTN|nr:hypothetical protein [Longispora fulva]MBG6136792.1 hypothetical protein [Longispora fulva]GIG59963.1 hypothetical protein Lfu02_43350 [Longispora fulva]
MNRTVLLGLARNGAVARAVLLALATVVLLAAGQRILIPFAVAAYAVANAVALTLATARATRATAPARPAGR